MGPRNSEVLSSGNGTVKGKIEQGHLEDSYNDTRAVPYPKYLCGPATPKPPRRLHEITRFWGR